MTKRVSAADLDPWRDPLDLLDVLTSVPTKELGDLRANVAALIHHEDVDVRTHAIRRLFVHLKDPSRHEEVVLLLQTDPEAEVRRVAAFAVAATTSKSTYNGDSKVLLEALLNESEDEMVRGAAYEALLLIHNRRDFPPVKADIDFAKDVDWEWVRGLQRVFQ